MQTKVCLICGAKHQHDAAILMSLRFTSEETAKRREKEMSEPSDYGDCEECTELKKKGIIIVAYDESKSNPSEDSRNPVAGLWRTGTRLVMSEKGYECMAYQLESHPQSKVILKSAKTARVLFLPYQIVERIKEANNG